jgi:hypothetical protein
VPDEWRREIEAARTEALTMVERRDGPFGEDWLSIPV